MNNVDKYIIRVLHFNGHYAELYFHENGQFVYADFKRPGINSVLTRLDGKDIQLIVDTVISENITIANAFDIVNSENTKGLHQLEANIDNSDGGLVRKCKVCGKSESYVYSLVESKNDRVSIDKEICPGIKVPDSTN